MEDTDNENVYASYSMNIHSYNKDKIKSKLYNTAAAEYNILNYDADVICNDDKKHGVYRSVVFSHPENKIVCFSPPKSILVDTFIARNPVLNDDIHVSEAIEGTTISLFFDARIQKWEISTKSAIGGNYWFFRNQYNTVDPESSQEYQPTFRQMFLDAFRANTDELNDLPFLEFFPKEYSYTFVLQHPANHIVLNIPSPVVYLVAIYHIFDDHIVAIPPTVFREWDIFLNIRGMIEFPFEFDELTYDEIQTRYCSIHSPPNIMGVMALNIETGDRCFIENPVYENARKIRGNHPNLQYQYLCLLRIDKVMEFLKWFPQYKSLFYKFHQQYFDFVTNVHQSYISHFVKKTGEPIAKKYFTHIHNIHQQIYLPSLSANNKIVIRRNVVNEYLLKIEPSSLLFFLQP